MKNFKDCSRKFYWSYKKELTTPYGATALRYGKAWHKVLESYYDHVKKHGWGGKDALGATALEAGLGSLDAVWEEETGDLEFKEDHRTKEALVESFLQYIANFSTDAHSLEILETEFKYMIPVELTNQEEKYFPFLVGKGILFTGIIDLVAKEHGHVWALEHKTTGMWMQQVQQTFRRSSQTQGYLWNVQQYFKKLGTLVEGIMINLHHLSAGKLKGGGYGKKKIDFLRDPQMYSEADFREWRLSSLAVLNDMQRAEKTGFYPMNLENCHAYNKPCPFTSLCEQNKINLEDTITDGFIKRKRDV